jgi:uncharacterized damage-inducible protein DinB
MTNAAVQLHWLKELDESRAQTLARADEGKVDPPALSSLADLEAFAALNLEPMSTNPVAHLDAGYARTRPYLERLTRHEASRIVSVSERDGYIYPMTPRKILRRVLDHALDHFNQLEQWIDWQDHGVVPAPTDGWAPSDVTFDEDTFPVTDAELSAWLWRIDRVMALLINRASGLTQAQLDWQPPDGGWTLHRVLHHVARGYGYAAWLDDALPEGGHARYNEAQRRLRKQVAHLLSTPPPPETAFYGNAGRQFTLAEMLHAVLAAEQEIRTTGRLAPVSSELD